MTAEELRKEILFANDYFNFTAGNYITCYDHMSTAGIAGMRRFLSELSTGYLTRANLVTGNSIDYCYKIIKAEKKHRESGSIKELTERLDNVARTCDNIDAGMAAFLPSLRELIGACDRLDADEMYILNVLLGEIMLFDNELSAPVFFNGDIYFKTSKRTDI